MDRAALSATYFFHSYVTVPYSSASLERTRPCSFLKDSEASQSALTQSISVSSITGTRSVVLSVLITKESRLWKKKDAQKQHLHFQKNIQINSWVCSRGLIISLKYSCHLTLYILDKIERLQLIHLKLADCKASVIKEQALTFNIRRIPVIDERWTIIYLCLNGSIL